MALSIINKNAQDARILNESEILAITDTCNKCGKIYNRYMRCKDGKIHGRPHCSECQGEMAGLAREARKANAVKKKTENECLAKRLEKARVDAEQRAEGISPVIEPVHVVESQKPVVESNSKVITLSLSEHDILFEELSLLAKRDVRSIEGEIIWILKDYVTYERAIATETLDRAKAERSHGLRQMKYRD